MNSLYRHLMPISDKAWEQIEQEASRMLKRHLSARRVVDVIGPKGFAVSAVGTGHLNQIASPEDGGETRQRGVNALVELRVPSSSRARQSTTTWTAAQRIRTGRPSRKRRPRSPSRKSALPCPRRRRLHRRKLR
jgi:hypothetical protein